MDWQQQVNSVLCANVLQNFSKEIASWNLVGFFVAQSVVHPFQFNDTIYCAFHLAYFVYVLN